MGHLVHAVLKKSDFTVVENENQELIQNDSLKRFEFALTIEN